MQLVFWCLFPPLSPAPTCRGEGSTEPAAIGIPGACGMGTHHALQWARQGGSTQQTQLPFADFRADSLPSLPFHRLLMAIIGEEGRSYKYLLKLKGVCTGLAERENTLRVPAPLPYTYSQVFALSFSSVSSGITGETIFDSPGKTPFLWSAVCSCQG